MAKGRAKCKACGEKFTGPHKLAIHCDATGHAKPGWLKQVEKKWGDKSVPGEEGDGFDDDTRPDWTSECENCGATPVVPVTGLCGVCTFGEADTLGGNW